MNVLLCLPALVGVLWEWQRADGVGVNGGQGQPAGAGGGGGAGKGSGHRRRAPASTMGGPSLAPTLPNLCSHRFPCLSCRRVQQFIREAYKGEWLVWSHEPEHVAEEEEAEPEERPPLSGGFTMRRK